MEDCDNLAEPLCIGDAQVYSKDRIAKPLMHNYCSDVNALLIL